MVSSAELQLINDNSQPDNDKDASGGDSPKVSPVGLQGAGDVTAALAHRRVCSKSTCALLRRMTPSRRTPMHS